MKKTLLAAALTMGFAGIAQAETSVTLYGIVDAGLQYEQVKVDNVGKATRSGMASSTQSGNRFGLKGSEDLGNGLKAIFTLEQGFTIGDGAGNSSRAFHRQAYVGLAGDSWGTFTMGRQYNIADSYFGSLGPIGNGFVLAAQPRTFASGGFRADNMFKYETPNFAGFQAAIGYSKNSSLSGSNEWDFKGYNGNADVDRDSGSLLTAGMRYSNGPIYAVATFDRLGDVAGAGASAGDNGSIKAFNLGAAYDFEVAKLHLGWGQDRDGRIAAGDNNLSETGAATPVRNARYYDGFKANNFLVGVSAPIGAGKIMASWAMSKSNLDDTAAYDIANQQTYALGYTYNLSKRTNVYAMAAYMKNVNYRDDAKAQQYSVGLRHQF